MNILDSRLPSDATDPSAVSKLTSEILPCCSLLGIIAGFTAFVAFGQAIVPALIAAVIGAAAGLFFACDEERAARDEQR